MLLRDAICAGTFVTQRRYEELGKLVQTIDVAGSSTTRVTAREEARMSFRDVLFKDIRDVRNISGTKYNKGLLDLIEYYRSNFPELMAKPSAPGGS